MLSQTEKNQVEFGTGLADVNLDGTDWNAVDPKGAMRTHAALLGSMLRKALRSRDPQYNVGHVTPLTANSNLTLMHAKPRSLIVKNYTNVTAYVWLGDTTQGPWFHTVGTLTYATIPWPSSNRVATISVAPGGSPATSGSCFADFTDAVFSLGQGTLAV